VGSRTAGKAHPIKVPGAVHAGHHADARIVRKAQVQLLLLSRSLLSRLYQAFYNTASHA
jgi:hypothetical protein